MFIVYSVADKETANSYISVDEFHNFQEIDYTINPLVLDVAEEEKLLMTASHIIDISYEYKGSKYDEVQHLQFPRDFEEEAINNDVKRATAQIAYDLYINKDFYIYEEDVKRERFEGMEVEYYRNTGKEKFKDNTFYLMRPYIYFVQFMETWRG